jgi:hypothetical protein
MAKGVCKNCEFKFGINCYRHPPQLLWINEGRGKGYFVSGWPEVLDSEWCGEFKLKDIYTTKLKNPILEKSKENK